MASGRKRGLKLHSIIEKLSEQCERKSPLRDDEGEDVHLNSELCNVKRKQRKGNGVKRVFKEPSSRSDSEEGSSDEEIPVIQNEVQNNKDLKKESEEKASACHTIRRAMLYPRAAKTNAWRKQTIKQQQKSETRTLDNKNKKENKGRKGKSSINSSKVIEESSGKGADEDLAIDVEAFVHHGPVMEDIDQASASFPCPFCSALCRDNQDVTQHIKDCHNSECAVVDHSEQDEETSSDSPTDVTDSDEDFTPNKKTTPKQKGRHAPKSQTSQNENAAAEVSEGELCIDVENVMGTESGVSDIDNPSANLVSTFLCVTCNVHFKTKNDLTAHITECSKKGSSKVSSSRFRCVCQACGMRFYQWTELRKHFDEKPDCRKMYQCDQCGQICLTTSFLRKHKRLHSDERPHKCSVCDAAFKDKAYLKRHGVKHTGIKEFKCDLCDKLFSHQRTLREHRRRHTGERPYKCKYCEATFINNSSLKTHTAKHTGILPYKCQACGKLFAKSYGLKMHSLSHSNEKPFVCEVCGKGFKRPDHFKQHKIIHSDDKPFKCDTCHRTFNQRVCLRKHLPCKERERQEKKLQNSLAKQNRTQNKPKRLKKSSTNAPRKSENPEDISQADCASPAVNDTATDRCEVSNDFSLPSPVETSDNSLLAGCYSPPSFVRPMSKLEDNVYYSEHEDTDQDYHQHDRDFSPQHLTDRTETSLLPASFVPAMFGVEEPLSLDTLPPLSSHHTHTLSGRPLSHDNATDLGSVFLSSPMDSENLSSIVEETNSFFDHD